VLHQLFPYLETALERRGEKLCATLDRAAIEKEGLRHAQQVTLMLAALGIFLGWRGVDKLLDDLNMRTLDGYDTRRAARQLVGERKRVSDWYRRQATLHDREFRYLSARLLPGLPRLLVKLTRARGDESAAAWFNERMEALGIADAPPAPLIMGRDLLAMGTKPGPHIGKILNEIYMAQLRGDIATAEQAQSRAREMLKDDD
jgi:hypothetical protein